MFQDGFRTTPPTPCPQKKGQGNFSFRGGVLNTIAKSSILMSLGGGGLEALPLNIFFKYVLNIHPLEEYCNLPLITL